jgi:hypothetical protein
MSVACASAARVSALFVRSGPQPALDRSLFVSCRTWASVEPLGAGGFVVGLVGVVVCRGFVGVGVGVRVAFRLGAVVDRVGVGVALGVLLGVFDGVLLGVTVGVGIGVASSTGGVVTSSVTEVSGSFCPVVSRVTYQPPAASRLRTAKAPMIGPATPRFRRR